jgi:hypothetical protein
VVFRGDRGDLPLRRAEGHHVVARLRGVDIHEDAALAGIDERFSGGVHFVKQPKN